MSRPGTLKVAALKRNAVRLETIAELTARIDRLEATVAALGRRLQRLEASRANGARDPREGEGEGGAEYEITSLIG